jgi:osmotically inducible lipoprotein OsmB
MEKAMRIITILAFIAGLVAGCGDTTEKRAASGGLIGGAAGLAVGAPVAGAAVGAGTGIVTEDED